MWSHVMTDSVYYSILQMFYYFMFQLVTATKCMPHTTLMCCSDYSVSLVFPEQTKSYKVYDLLEYKENWEVKCK